MTRSRLILCLAAIPSLVSLGDARGDPSNVDPLLYAAHPFDTTTAQENLLYCEPSLSQEDVGRLTRVNYMYYDFVPPQGEGSEQGFPSVNTTRFVSFALPDFSVAAIAPKVASLNISSCETEVKASGLGLGLTDKRHLRAQFHVDASLRKCGSFLGIPYKIDVGDGYADIALNYKVTDDFSVVPDGGPVVSNRHISSNWFFRLIGVFFGLPPEVSFLVGGNFLNAQMGRLRDNISFAAGDSGQQDVFKAFNAARGSILRYTQTLEGLPDATMVSDPSASGLEQAPDGSMNFLLVQRNSLPNSYGPMLYDTRKGEIQFINDLKTPRPRHYTVVAGDNLWNIAKSYKLDPYSYILLEDINGIRGKKIKPGQVLEVPIESEYCHKMIIEDSIVRPGDTLVSIAKRKSFSPSAKHLRSGNPNRIYPYEEIMPAVPN